MPFAEGDGFDKTGSAAGLPHAAPADLMASVRWIAHDVVRRAQTPRAGCSAHCPSGVLAVRGVTVRPAVLDGPEQLDRTGCRDAPSESAALASI